MNERYSRQTILEGIGPSGQAKLNAAQVAVVGCGGLGAIAAAYLAGAGIGNLILIDGDKPELSNLHRQVFFSPENQKTKAEELQIKLSKLNSDIYIKAVPAHLTKTNIDELLTGIDLVLECTDNQPTKYLVNDFCALEGIPTVYSAIHKYEGYVSLFANQTEEDIHLRDIFPIPNPNLPVCSEVGVMNTIAGLMGVLQANEALKHLLGIGESLSGKLLTYDCLTNRQLVIQLNKNWTEDLELLYENNSYKEEANDHIPEIEYADLIKERDSIHLISVMAKAEHHAIDAETTWKAADELSSADLSTDKKNVLYCRQGRISRQVISRLLKVDNTLNVYSLKDGYKSVLKK